MFPTIPLTSITEKWLGAIANSPAISDFVTQAYGASLSLYYSIDGKKPPTDLKCPLIILFPISKLEGAGEPEHSYTIGIGWSILQPHVTTSNAGNAVVYKYDGLDEMDTLGQLILATVAEVNPSFPITTADYRVESTAFFPQFVGRMDVTIHIPVVMGAQISY